MPTTVLTSGLFIPFCSVCDAACQQSLPVELSEALAFWESDFGCLHWDMFSHCLALYFYGGRAAANALWLLFTLCFFAHVTDTHHISHQLDEFAVSNVKKKVRVLLWQVTDIST